MAALHHMQIPHLKDSPWPSDRLYAAADQFERCVPLRPEKRGYWESWFEKIDETDRQVSIAVDSVSRAFLAGSPMPPLSDIEVFCFCLRLRFAATVLGHFECDDRECPIPLIPPEGITTATDLVAWLMIDAWSSFGRSLMSLFVYQLLHWL